MVQPHIQISMMPARRRGMGLVVVLWAFLIALGIYGVLGLAGVRLPLWHDHIDIRAAWPPVRLAPGPQHRPDEPRSLAPHRP